MLDDREIELIAALVEGRLEDETQARALLERSSEARAEYEAQLVAYNALTAEARSVMSASERASLHRDLWTALRHEQTTATKKRPWLYGWIPVAAGLFLVVGLLAVLTQGGISQQSEPFAEIAAESGGATDESREADGVVEAEEESLQTTDADSASPETMSEAEFFSETAAQVRSGELDDAGLSPAADGTNPDACIDRAGLSDHDVLGEATHTGSEEDGTSTVYLVAVPADTAIGPETPVAFVTAETCQLAHIED